MQQLARVTQVDGLPRLVALGDWPLRQVDEVSQVLLQGLQDDLESVKEGQRWPTSTSTTGLMASISLHLGYPKGQLGGAVVLVWGPRSRLEAGCKFATESLSEGLDIYLRLKSAVLVRTQKGYVR